MKRIILLDFLISYLFFCTAVEISLVGKAAIQSGTWGNLGANFAIDGNNLTYSVAVAQGSVNAFGWWEVDLGGTYTIGRVSITASEDDTNARYLQNFDIWFLKEDRSEKLCYKYSDPDYILPTTSKSFNCDPMPIATRYIRIARYGSSYRTDALALAEVQAYTESLSIAVAEERIISTDIEGFEIPLQGLNTSHSSVWGDHSSHLAIDGNNNTFSIACVLCDGSLNAGVGWWQIDFERQRNIVGIKITSSPDLYNSQYLKNFIVAVTQSNTTDLLGANICFDYNHGGEVPVLTTLIIKCNNPPAAGRFLIVQRKTSGFRPDAIAIAEIKVYEF